MKRREEKNQIRFFKKAPTEGGWLERKKIITDVFRRSFLTLYKCQQFTVDLLSSYMLDCNN